MRPLAPALGALVPLLPLPVAELNGVYCLRLHISPPDWAVPTICDADRHYRPHSEWRKRVLKRILPRLTYANVVEGREAEARRPSALATPMVPSGSAGGEP